MPKPVATTPYSEALNQAIRRIYEVYGADLSAFFRDVSDAPVTVAKHGGHIQLRIDTHQTQRREKARATR
jgi:hypothetical protein